MSPAGRLGAGRDKCTLEGLEALPRTIGNQLPKTDWVQRRRKPPTVPVHSWQHCPGCQQQTLGHDTCDLPKMTQRAALFVCRGSSTKQPQRVTLGKGTRVYSAPFLFLQLSCVNYFQIVKNQKIKKMKCGHLPCSGSIDAQRGG